MNVLEVEGFAPFRVINELLTVSVFLLLSKYGSCKIEEQR